MSDIKSLLAGLSAQREMQRIARNPLAQFGTRTRRYLGAELLPNKTVPANMFTEEMIRYRSVIANAGTRYSPTQKRGGALVGSFDVKLAESDIKSELTSRDYDALVTYLQRNDAMAAMASLTNFVDTTVNVPMEEILELWRWQAIVDASVELVGDNEYSESVSYSNPSGHRFSASDTWSDDTFDPFTDIWSAAQKLADKGYSVRRIITSRNVIGILAANAKVKTRTSRVVVNGSGQITAAVGRVTLAEINAIAQADGLPAFETYDLKYRTMTSSARFMDDDVMVFVADSGRDETLDLGDTGQGVPEILEGTLGYTAIGRAAGQGSPGRVIRVESFESKPPRVEAEGWQTALPVVTEPEAIVVVKDIA